MITDERIAELADAAGLTVEAFAVIAAEWAWETNSDEVA